MLVSCFEWVVCIGTFLGRASELTDGVSTGTGPQDRIASYFAARGFPVPPNISLSDWMLHVAQEADSTEALLAQGFFGEERVDDSQKAWKSSLARRRSSMIYTSGRAPFATSSPRLGRQSQRRRSTMAELIFKSATERSESAGYAGLPVWKETSMLFKREWTHLYRDSQTMKMRFMMCFCGAAVIAVVFQGVGGGTITSLAEFQSHAGVIFFLVMVCCIASQLILLDFAESRDIFVREFGTGHYKMVSYFLSKTITESVNVFFQTFVLTTITFWAIGLQGRYWYMLLCMYSFAMANSSIAVLMASGVADVRSSKELFPIILGT